MSIGAGLLAGKDALAGLGTRIEPRASSAVPYEVAEEASSEVGGDMIEGVRVNLHGVGIPIESQP
jgi:hypothetical protein